MLNKIWQWFKKLFQRLFGSKSTSISLGKNRNLQDQQRDSQPTSSPTLSDTDYEFLFSQLLEGVAHGWNETRIVGFFEKLGDRGKSEQWIAWLHRFGDKVLASPSPNQQLGARLLRFGEATQGVRSVQSIGQVAYKIGQQLLTRNSITSSAVWEYAGPDTQESMPSSSQQPEQVAGESMPEQLETTASSSPPNQQQELITLDQLLIRLQQDPNLANQLAQQLGIESREPQVIMEAFLAHLQQVQGQDRGTPSTDQDWFNLGFEQAQGGQWEQAIASWDRALELNPNLPQVWHNRGNALRQLKRWEEALTSFEKVLEFQPDNYQVWNDLGNILYTLERWEAALSSWDRVVEIEPNYYQAWFNRGCALEHLGSIEASLASYHKALEIEPNFELAKSRISQLQGNM